MIAVWCFAAFWNLISSPVVFVLPREIARDGNYVALLAFVFPLAGVGILIWAIRSTIQWRKFGNSTFELASVPGVIGGSLGGVILMGRHIRPEGGFYVKLSCVNRVTTGSGDNESTTEHILWESEQQLDRELLGSDPSRSAIPVYFQIPYTCAETHSEPSDNNIVWRLEARAEVPGVDYEAVFEAPVFKTEQSSEQPAAQDDPLAPYRSKETALPSLEPVGIFQRPTASGGMEFEFPAWRSTLWSLSVLTIGMVLGIGVFFMYRAGAPVVVPIMCALFALLLT